jgi:hypothetical protein
MVYSPIRIKPYKKGMAPRWRKIRFTSKKLKKNNTLGN